MRIVNQCQRMRGERRAKPTLGVVRRPGPWISGDRLPAYSPDSRLHFFPSSLSFRPARAAQKPSPSRPILFDRLARVNKPPSFSSSSSHAPLSHAAPVTDAASGIYNAIELASSRRPRSPMKRQRQHVYSEHPYTPLYGRA